MAFSASNNYEVVSEFYGTAHRIVGVVDTLARSSQLAGKVDKEPGKGLFSGIYNDLTGKPTIPDISGLATKQEVSELTITTAKVTDLDSYKNPAISASALVAIDGINNA